MAPITAVEKAERTREFLKVKVDHFSKKILDTTTTPLPIRMVTQYLVAIATAKDKLEEVHQVLSHSVDHSNTGPHTAEHITLFIKLVKFVKQQHLCQNGFREGHSANQCPSTGMCKNCKEVHSNLFHIGEFGKILLGGSRTGPISAPVARRSTLGRLNGGDLDAVSTTMVPPIHVHIADPALDIHQQQFWELQPVPTTRVMTSDKKACKDHFSNTHSIDLEGRFSVNQPFKNSCPVIGSKQPYKNPRPVIGSQQPSGAIKFSTEPLDPTSRDGLNLRKWSSNSNELLLSIPPELRETQPVLQFDDDQTVKSLGILWCTTQDQMLFKVTLPEPESLKEGGDGLTKRKVLSEMSKTFDPMGWLSHAIIKAKILIQQLWKLNLGWDVVLPIDVQQQWVKFKFDLPFIEEVKINRCVVPCHSSRVSLVGFCDAFELAYAAVVYIRAEHQDTTQQPTVTLVMSKTRVAPVKQVSLPRLELCGAVLLSQLMSTVQRAMKIEFDSVSAWTDSTVVLSWIQCHPSRWKTFIANRVTEIQERVPAALWGHVSGIENPADCASRGLDPLEVINHNLWWTGPSWLTSGTIPVTGKVQSVPINIDLEERKIVLCANAATVQQDDIMLSKFSSLTRLKRVTAWCFRYVNNCRLKCAKDRNISPLSPQELEYSLSWWIRIIQEESFPSEIQCLKDNKPLSHKSKLQNLNPFLDSSLLLRVAGRLQCNPSLHVDTG